VDEIVQRPLQAAGTLLGQVTPQVPGSSCSLCKLSQQPEVPHGYCLLMVCYHPSRHLLRLDPLGIHPLLAQVGLVGVL
jgi:hypothetical protein